MTKTKLGIYQAIAMVVTVMISHIILNLPNHLLSETGPSTILNLIYIFVITFVIFYAVTKVFELFPNQDIIDICEYTSGKTVKNIFSIGIIVYLLIISAFVIRIFAGSLVLIYFPNIDIGIVILIFIAITAILNIFGLKTISRSALIILPVILITMVTIFVSSGSDFVYQRAFPILGYGAYETFILGLGNIFAFSSLFIIELIPPLLGESKDLKKIAIVSLIVYGIYLILGVIALLFLFPSITEISNTLSIYILARRVNFGDFIQRIDAVFILIWIISIFSYLSIVMYFILNTFKKITNIKHKKPMVFCFCSILFVISMIPSNISNIRFFENTFYRYASIIFVFFICSAILITGYIKKKRELKKGENSLEKAS